MTLNVAIVLFVIATLAGLIVLLLITLSRQQNNKTGSADSAPEHLERYLLIDPDTGIYDHRYFHKKLDEEIYRANRYNMKFTVAIFDFKDLFSNENREKVSTVIRKISSLLSRDTRFTDIVARIDKTQLGILFSMTPRQNAELPITRFTNKISEILSSENINDKLSTVVMGFPDDKNKIKKLSQEMRRK